MKFCVRDTSRHSRLRFFSTVAVSPPRQQNAFPSDEQIREIKNLKMLLDGGGGSQVVVQVDEDAVLVGEGAVHQPLEGLGGILQAQRHVEVLEEPEGCDDSRLGDVGGGDRHLVVARD